MSDRPEIPRLRKWTTPAMIIAAITLVGSFFVPEVRRFVGLEKPVHPSSVIATAGPGRPSAVPPRSNSVVTNPKITQRAKIKVKGSKNVIGNIVTGQGNIVGNNNQINSVNAPPVEVVSAPNGIAIGGGIVNNPTVNNNFGPPPLPTPNVTVCVSHSVAPDGQQNLTTISFNTDVRVTEPWYALWFDAPVLDGRLEMSGHVAGFIHQRADKMPNPETSFVFKITSVDMGTDIWRPGEEITVTVPSKTPVHLVKTIWGSVDAGLPEAVTFPCGR